MDRTSKKLLLVGLGVLLMLGLVGLASAIDSDGDGVDDASDLCLGTPQGHAADANGCSDFDSDGVYGYIDNCPEAANAGQEDNADGDGRGDECDICPRTDPRWTVAGNTVSAEGCADEDMDGVSDYCDDCLTTEPLEHRHDFLLDERGCWEKHWVHIRSTAPVEHPYNGDPYMSRAW